MSYPWRLSLAEVSPDLEAENVLGKGIEVARGKWGWGEEGNNRKLAPACQAEGGEILDRAGLC